MPAAAHKQSEEVMEIRTYVATGLTATAELASDSRVARDQLLQDAPSHVSLILGKEI